jgi:hypothetical protein
MTCWLIATLICVLIMSQRACATSKYTSRNVNCIVKPLNKSKEICPWPCTFSLQDMIHTKQVPLTERIPLAVWPTWRTAHPRLVTYHAFLKKSPSQCGRRTRRHRPKCWVTGPRDKTAMDQSLTHTRSILRCLSKLWRHSDLRVSRKRTRNAHSIVS